MMEVRLVHNLASVKQMQHVLDLLQNAGGASLADEPIRVERVRGGAFVTYSLVSGLCEDEYIDLELALRGEGGD